MVARLIRGKKGRYNELRKLPVGVSLLVIVSVSTVQHANFQCSNCCVLTGKSMAREPDSWYPLGSVVLCAIMFVATVVGVVGNILTFYIFSLRKMRSSINILLAGLALIDVCVLVFGTIVFLPFGTWAYFYHTNPFLYDNMGAYLLVFFQPLPLIAQTASIWALILITVERYMAVCYPFLAKRFCTTNRSLLALGLLIIWALSYNFCRFWEYELVVQSNITTYRKLLKGNGGYQQVYTMYMYLIFMFLIPFILLSSLNIRIMISIRKAGLKRQIMSLRKENRKEQKITVMMLIVILVFLICNCLAFILQIFEVCSLRIPIHLFFFLTDISNLLVEVNSSINCVIYYKFCVKYRIEVKRILMGCRSLRSSDSQSGPEATQMLEKNNSFVQTTEML